MSRLSVLAAQPRVALGALLTLLLAAAAVVGSGANFSASSANPANTFAAGTLEIINSKEANFILRASNMKPTDTDVSTVDIENNGTLAGVFTLSRTAPVDSDTTNRMSGKLNVTVLDCGDFLSGTPTCAAGDDVVYSGTLADMGESGHPVASLGSYDADEKHRYQFSVQLDGSADNAYQGDSSSVEFDFNAVQS